MTAKAKETTVLMGLGSVGYGLIEVLWRGFTHWSMLLTGGLSFLCLHRMNVRFPHKKLFNKCFLGSTIITSLEFAVGCIVNLGFHWNVWDYSQKKWNLLGQICPQYAGLWFLLCIPVLGLSQYLRGHLFSHPKFLCFKQREKTVEPMPLAKACQTEMEKAES